MYEKLLIIDDDIDLSNLLKTCIENNDIKVDIANTASEGIKLFNNNEYKLIVFDVMLPDINGLSLLSKIRNKSNIPILMLTAKNTEEDKVLGLHLGADDYLTKPFGINEFLARIESLIRRYTTFNNSIDNKSNILQFKNLKIDFLNRTVTVDDTIVNLTAKEFDLLYFFASNQGKIFTKKQLYNNVWNDEYAFDDNNIMSFISKLRKKLSINSDTTQYIETIRGVGYRFSNEVWLWLTISY